MWQIKYLYNYGRLSNKRYGTFIVYYNPYITIIYQYFNHKVHHLVKPAMVEYKSDEYLNELAQHMAYYVNGKRHRITGPAYVNFTISDSFRLYAYNDRFIKYDDYLSKLKNK